MIEIIGSNSNRSIYQTFFKWFWWSCHTCMADDFSQHAKYTFVKKKRIWFSNKPLHWPLWIIFLISRSSLKKNAKKFKMILKIIKILLWYNIFFILVPGVAGYNIHILSHHESYYVHDHMLECHLLVYLACFQLNC